MVSQGAAVAENSVAGGKVPAERKSLGRATVVPKIGGGGAEAERAAEVAGVEERVAGL